MCAPVPSCGSSDPCLSWWTSTTGGWPLTHLSWTVRRGSNSREEGKRDVPPVKAGGGWWSLFFRGRDDTWSSAENTFFSLHPVTDSTQPGEVCRKQSYAEGQKGRRGSSSSREMSADQVQVVCGRRTRLFVWMNGLGEMSPFLCWGHDRHRGMVRRRISDEKSSRSRS